MRREAGHVLAVLAAESAGRRATARHATVIHVSVNPPPELWSTVDDPSGRGFRRLRAKAYRIARKAGVEGGATVFHRVRCADKDDPIETDGPHFHIVGFGWVRDGGDTYRRTGWVVKNHGVRRDARAVRGTVAYLLSHSYRAEACGGISQEGKSLGVTLTVTWFGRSIRASEVPSEGAYCPLCERCYPLGLWLPLEYIGQGPPPTQAVTIDWADWRAYALDRTGGWGQTVRVPITQ
jgi:hypothetical protein